MNATSVQWGPWADVGMAADASINARIQAGGIGLISLEQGTLAFQATLQPAASGVMSLVVLTWSKFLGADARGAAAARQLLGPEGARRRRRLGAGEVKAVTLEAILEVLKATTGAEVDPDAPLMEAGLDSLGAVELGNQLQAQSGAALPSTLVFDYPTARQLAGYFEEQAEAAAEGGRRCRRPSGSSGRPRRWRRRGRCRLARQPAERHRDAVAAARSWPRAAATASARCRRSGGRWRLLWLAWTRSSASACGTAAS